MKISLKWMQSFTSANLAPDGVDALVEKIGAQLGAVEEVIDLGKKYTDIVVVRVVECLPHDDSDHLNVCLIDDGNVTKNVERNSAGLVQVVCGAPNVTADILVAWIPPGAIVPSSIDTEPFVLEARELRGKVSNGMLASPKELALGDSHEGLLIIDQAARPGQTLAEVLDLDDYIIDVENKMFTHRPDCFGQLGVAREIAGIQHLPFHSPEWYNKNLGVQVNVDQQLRVEVKNEIPELVKRFSVIPMSNITVGPSPMWLQSYLLRVGIRPINNVVDLTNYYMMLTGQPLHAYDYDKVVAQDDGSDHATLTIRYPHDGEKLTLLNGKEIIPRKEAIIIGSASKAIGLGGVMGGANTEVDENTKNIILECANFDMYSIRRTSMYHGLFTDAVTRFNKGQSPLQNMAVLTKIVDDIVQIVDGRVAGECVDDKHIDTTENAVHVTVKFVNDRLGLRLTADDMAALLANVEFKVSADNDHLVVTAPFWRTDIEIPEDIVEEVGRLYGYDHLPLQLPLRSLRPAPKNELLQLKSRVRDVLSRAGANEVLGYSFVHGELLKKVGQDPGQAFQLSNALSPDLQYYRLSLTPSLLEKVHPNAKAGYNEFALFELGKVHAQQAVDDAGLPQEFDRLALVWTRAKTDNLSGAAYYQVRQYLDYLFDKFQMAERVIFKPLAAYDFGEHSLAAQMAAPYEPTRSAVLMLDESPIGVIGEFKAQPRRLLKLPKATAGFELYLSALVAMADRQYVALPRFPRVTQDMTLRVPGDLAVGDLQAAVKDELDARKPSRSQAVLTMTDIYKKEGAEAHQQVTFRLEIASYEKTMTDTEVNKLLDEIAAAAGERFKAERV